MRRFVISALAIVLLAGSVLAQEPVNNGIFAARSLSDAGDTEGAIKLLRKLAAEYPDDRQPHWWLANLLYSKAGRRREAAEVIDGFLERHSRDRYALELLVAIAHDALAAAEPDVARYAARRLLMYQPNVKDHLYLAARASYLMGERDSARQACRLILDEWPSDRDAHLLLARAQEDDGLFEDAAVTYMALIEERPGYAPARLALGSIVRLELRDYDRAEAIFTAALDVSDEGSPAALEARRGIEAVRADRAFEDRLREHRAFLMGLVIALVSGFAGLAAGVAYVSRARR